MNPISTLCLTLCVTALLSPIELAAQDRSDVVINELHYRPEEPTQEFVELYNRSSSTVDLSAFAISDDRMNMVAITDESYPLAPGSYAVLVRDGEDFAAAFPGISFVEPPTWPILRQTGDSSVLYRNGEVVDSVGYQPDWGGYERNVSLERIDPDGPSHHASNFGSSDGPPTPGEQNSIFQPNTTPPEPIFASARQSTVALHFNEPLDAQSLDPPAFELQGGGHPEAVELQQSLTEVRLAFSSPVDADELLVRGVRDLSGNLLGEASVALSFPPRQMEGDRSGDLVINEIMYQPRYDAYDGEPDQVEYIELYNAGNRPLTLEGLRRTNRSTQHGEADTTIFAAALTSLAPGEFALLHARRDDVNLEDAFPEAASSLRDGITLKHTSVRLGLRTSGDLIKLHREDGAVIDSVFYDPAWHHQQVGDPRGISLERVSVQGNPNDPNNWTSSLHPDGGTPLQENASATEPDLPERAGTMSITPQTFTPSGGGEHTQTAIAYRLESDEAMVSVKIYDTMGRLIRNLERGRPAGRFEDAVIWDGRDDNGRIVRLGVYVVHLEAVLYDSNDVEHHRSPVVVADPF